MPKWWDNFKERLGIGESALEKSLKEAEERSVKEQQQEQEREAKNIFFKGIRSDEKTEQRVAQREELSELRKGFAENEQKVTEERRNKAVNDPAFKDFPDEPKVPKMNNDLRQRSEIPEGKPIKASKPLPQVPGEFVDTLSSNEKLPQTPIDKFNEMMDKAVQAALEENKQKAAAKPYGALADAPETFTDKNSIPPKPLTPDDMKRGRSGTQYGGMPSKDTQYVELDKVPKPGDRAYGVMPSQDPTQKGGNYQGITTSGYQTTPEFIEAIDGKQRPQEAARPRAETAGQKYHTDAREQTPLFKVIEEVRGRDDAIRLTGQMDAVQFDSVNKGMESFPAAAEATKGALKEGKELDAALKVGGKVVESEVKANVERSAASMKLPNLEEQQAAKNAARDQYAGMDKAIQKAEIQRAAVQYGETPEISKQAKRLTTTNQVTKDSPYGEMPSVAAAVKDFPPKDVAAIMGAAQGIGGNSKGKISEAKSTSLEVGGNAKTGGSKSL